MIPIHHRYKVLSMTFILSIMQVSVVQAVQTCESTIPNTTPTADFTVHNNGTVTHTPTGLMWKVCSEGQTWQSSDGSCSGTATKHTWQAALQIPQTLNTQGGYADHTDWRLPNIKELGSIVELACYGPAINTALFNNTSYLAYWSATINNYSNDYAWAVQFTSGYRNQERRIVSNHVRLVRSGQ